MSLNARRAQPISGQLKRLSCRLGVIGATSAVALVSFAGIADAHVTAQPGNAAQGSYTKISFRTPNEKDNANTVKLEVDFPSDHPIAEASTEPLPGGWTANVEKTDLKTPIKTDDGEATQAVSKITWSGGQLAPGQFEDFSVSLGPLPSDTNKLVFKALQTYSDGDVVRWIDVAPPGSPEPEHPAPTLSLTPGESDEHTGDGSSAASSSGGGVGIVLGIAGIVLGLAGVVLGGLAMRRRTSTG
ncbi:MAG: YcnI family protein [Pseudonocardia sp.]|nr:YcnI family protein [Pseudonocardia sp.]